MPTYKPNYKKIFKFYSNIKYETIDDILIPYEELEVLCVIQGRLVKYLPFNENARDEVAEGVWLDYFLDTEMNGRKIKPKTFCDHLSYKGYKSLHHQKGLFLKIKTQDNEFLKDIYDIYIKIRRVQYNKCINPKMKEECGFDIYCNKCSANKEQYECCKSDNKNGKI